MPTMRNKKLVNESVGAKPKERSKTGIARKLAMGTPLVASASGVKGGRGANRAFGALTGVTAGKKGIKVDPLGLAMAVSPLKLAKVASALSKAGRLGSALEVADRVLVKTMGKALGRSKAIARMQPLGSYGHGGTTIENLQELRGLTRDVFPRPAVARPNRISQLVNESRSKAASKAQSEKWLGEHIVNPIEKRMAVPGRTAAAAYRARVEGTRVTELENRLSLGWAKKGRRSK